MFYYSICAYLGLRGLQVLRVHLVLQDLRGRGVHLVFQLVGVGRLRVDGRQLDLQVLLKEDDLIRRPWSKIVCLFVSYLTWASWSSRTAWTAWAAGHS